MIVIVKPRHSVYRNNRFYSAGETFKTDSMDDIEESCIELKPKKTKTKSKSKEI